MKPVRVLPDLWCFKDTCNVYLSQFRGFTAGARLMLKWNPDIVAGGHTNCYRFSPSKFRKIVRWAEFAEKATRALCPSGNLKRDYYSVHRKPLPPSWVRLLHDL